MKKEAESKKLVYDKCPHEFSKDVRVVHLEIHGCSECLDLTDISEKFPQLEELVLENMTMLEKIPTFTNLRNFSCKNCPNLKMTIGRGYIGTVKTDHCKINF